MRSRMCGKESNREDVMNEGVKVSPFRIVLILALLPHMYALLLCTELAMVVSCPPCYLCLSSMLK